MERLLNIFSQWQAVVVGVVIGALAGIVVRRLVARLLVWCASRYGGSAIAKGLRGIGIPACWLHYTESSNAVVERHIRNCRNYLRMHFADGDKGEIWLYNSDLNAFLNRDEFKALYLDNVAKNDRITSVKLLLRQDILKQLIPAKESWEKIDTRLKQDDAKPLESKLLYCFPENLPDQQAEVFNDPQFRAYTSDEGFIFYTRGQSLTWMEAVCVHRRLSGDGSEREDLRITVTASRPNRDSDGFHKFMPEDWQNRFETLFEPGEHWEPFVALVKDKLS